MGFVVELKPDEKIIVGQFVLTFRGAHRAKLHIEGDGPIMRESEVMKPEEAVTPAKRLYLLAQGMYLSGDLAKGQDAFFALARDIVAAAPSATPFIAAAGEHLLAGRMFKALRELKSLIAYEAELLSGPTSP